MGWRSTEIQQEPESEDEESVERAASKNPGPGRDDVIILCPRVETPQSRLELTNAMKKDHKNWLVNTPIDEFRKKFGFSGFGSGTRATSGYGSASGWRTPVVV